MSDSTVSLDRLVAWLGRFTELVTDQRAYLTELDSAIGDADHGANMSRGMTAVMEKLDGATPGAADDLFKTVGMTLVTSVGGASGPLYGTFFLRMGMSAGATSSVEAPALGAALRAGLDGVVARGKAEAGDKTMFDAMAPGIARQCRRGRVRRSRDRPRRDRTARRPQGPRQLPGRAQRRPPRPGGDVHRAAVPGARRDARGVAP